MRSSLHTQMLICLSFPDLSVHFATLFCPFNFLLKLTIDLRKANSLFLSLSSHKLEQQQQQQQLDQQQLTYVITLEKSGDFH